MLCIYLFDIYSFIFTCIYLYDILYKIIMLQAAQGFPFESWLTSSLHDQIIKLGDWSFVNKFRGDDEFSRLVGGKKIFFRDVFEFKSFFNSEWLFFFLVFK